MSLGALMSPVFEPYGYAPSELAIIGLILLLTGVVSSIIVGIVVDKTGWYKRTMSFLGFGVLLTVILVIIALSFFAEAKGIVIACFALLGLFAIGYVPLSFAYGAELTFPLQPALVNGTLTLLGSFTAFLLSLLSAFIIEPGDGQDELPEEEQNEIQRGKSIYVISIVLITTLIAFVIG